MKSLVFTILIVLLASCGIGKYTLKPNELVKFSNRNDTIFYSSKPIAFLQSMEYELYKGSLTHELSLIQFDGEPENTINIIKYAHTLHPTSKIEVKHK
jgi:hypothetical protein